jgi:hypothetical protein
MKMLNLIYIIGLGLLMACSKKTTAIDTVVPASNRIINVQTASQLKTALATAVAGDEIIMADGLYSGKFVIASGMNGTAAKPITLRGSRNVVLDAGDINTGYVLYLQSSYWIIKGFTIAKRSCRRLYPRKA